MRPVDRMLEHLSGVQERGGYHVALCPAHADNNPSLSISVGSDSRALLYCHAGCSKEDVLDALNLSKRDLFENNGHNGHRSSDDARTATSASRVWDVRDADGKLVARHHRRDTPDGKKIWWRGPGDEKRLRDIGLTPSDLPLYGAEMSADWHARGAVIVVEGEPAADALQALGIPTAATVTGASTTPGTDALEVLRGRRVILWADADDPGREHARRIAERLQSVAEQVQMFTWADAPDGGDAADHPAIQSPEPGAIQALVDALTAAPLWKPQEKPTDAPEGAERLLGRVLLGQAVRDGVEPPEELVRDVMLSGRVHSIHAGAGTGKTFLLLWLAKQAIERGRRVLIFDLENGRRIVSERLAELGADPEKLDALLYYFPFPSLPLDARVKAQYEALLDQVEPALVLFDSWVELLACAGLDENSSTDVAAWSTAYSKPARERGMSVVLLDHVPHEGKHARGSTRKRDYVDVQFALRNPTPFDRDRVGRITLHREKDREGWLPESVGFSVGGGEAGFIFERSAGTVEEPDPADGLHPSERDTLEALREYGEEGATDRQWKDAADHRKVSKSSYYRAKRVLLETSRAHQSGETFTAEPEPERGPTKSHGTPAGSEEPTPERSHGSHHPMGGTRGTTAGPREEDATKTTEEANDGWTGVFG